MEKLGGKRGGQAIAGMLEDFSQVEKALDTMENAAGSADAEMSIIEDSIDYKLNAIKQTWVGVIQDLISRDDFKQLLDNLLKISEALSSFIASAGTKGLAVLSGLFLVIANGVKGLKTGESVVLSFTKAILSLGNASESVSGLGSFFSSLFSDWKGLNEILGKSDLAENLGEAFGDAISSSEATEGLAEKAAETIEESVSDAVDSVKENLSDKFNDALSSWLSPEDINVDELTEATEGLAGANATLEASNQGVAASEAQKATAQQESIITTGEETLATQAETKSEEENILANQSDAYSEMMEAQAELASAASSGTEAGATITETGIGVLKGLKAVIGLINPAVGFLAAGIAATGIAAFAAYKYFNRFRDALKDAKKSTEEANKALSDVEGKLSDVQSQIESIKSDGVITITEQADLDRLEKQNKALEVQLKYRKLIADQENQKVVDAAKDVWNDEFGSTNSEADSIMRGQMLTGALGMPGAGFAYVNADTTQKTRTDRVSEEYEQALKAHENASKALEDAQKAAELDGEVTEEERKQIDELTKTEQKRSDALRDADTKRANQLTAIQEQIDLLGLTEEGRNSDEYQQALGQQRQLVKINPEDVAQWNEDEIKSIIEDLGLTDEELTELAKTGIDSTDSVEGLSKALKDTDFILEDGQTALSLFNQYLKEYKQETELSGNSTSQWSSVLSEALEKLGTSEDDFNKLVNSIKELNPELNKNQEAAERAALANLQFSKAAEDLSSNFETYKESIEQGNKLSVEYNEAITNLADDLTYLTGVDFSLIDTEAWTKNQENIDLLDQALEGIPEALEKIRTNAQDELIVKIKAKISEIDDSEIKDLAINAKLNTNQFTTELQSLVEWMEGSDLGIVEATAVLNDSPFMATLIELASQSSETARSIQRIFEELGWDMTWDLKPMIVPKATGSKVAGGIPSDVAKNLKGYNSSTGTVNYEMEEIGVPTNIRFTKRGSTAGSVKNYTPSSIPKSSGGSSSGGGGGGSDSEQEPQEETFDWIETRISRLERDIQNLDKVVNASYKNWGDRLKGIPSEYSTILQEIETQNAAYVRYMQEAANVGLSEEYAEKVRNGLIDIEKITDDTLKEQINSYKEYYEKAINCADAVEDLRGSLADLAQTRFDSINTQFDSILARIEHGKDIVNSTMSIVEKQGHLLSTEYYGGLITLENENISRLQHQYSELKIVQEDALASGAIEKNSEAWNNMQSSIDDVESSIYDAKEALIDYANEMRQLEWDLFDRKMDTVSLLTDESDWLQELIRTEHKITDSTNGRLNQYGQSIGGLILIDYETEINKAKSYAQEIKKINAQLANDPKNVTLIDRRNELLKLQRESIKATEDEKEAVRSLTKESYDAMLDILQKMIDKRKEALQAEKNLYDYQNTIQDKTDNISSIQKQLMSLGNDTSEENKARLQKLSDELRTAEKDLAETEYDKWLSDQNQMLDELYSDTEEFLNAKLEDIDALLQEMIQTTNDNGSVISSTISDEIGEVGYVLSEDLNGLLGQITTDDANILSAVDTTYREINYSVDALPDKAEMETMINSVNTILGTLPTYEGMNGLFSNLSQWINNAASNIVTAIGSIQTSTQTTVETTTSSGDSSSGGGGGSKSTTTSSKSNTSGGKVYGTPVGSSGFSNNQPSKTTTTSSTKSTIGTDLANPKHTKRGTYAKGGTIGKAIKRTGEDGIILARTGEEVLSLEKIAQMKDVLVAFEPLANALSTINSIPKTNDSTTNSVVNEISVSFELPNVSNYEEFIQTARTDARFERIVQQMTLGSALGQNSLKKLTR